MSESSWQFYIPAALVYSISLLGLGVSLLSLRSPESASEPSPEPSVVEADPSISSSESISESSAKERELLRKRRTASINAKTELRFFKDLNVFFRLDNRYIFYLVALVAVIITVFCFLYAHIIFAIAFVIGFAQFFGGFCFTRALFIKTSLGLDLTSDIKTVRWKNWHSFIGFVFASLIFALSSTTLAVYTIYLIYQGNKVNHKENGNKGSSEDDCSGFIDPHKNMFVLMLFFYYCGKNLLHIFNNMWESFNMNKQILKLLSKQYNRTKMLDFYSQGYYFNVMGRIYRQGIIVADLLVVLTICVFQLTRSVGQFFVYFYAVLVGMMLVFHWVVSLGFNFKDSKDAISMITVLKLGFTYFFVIAFLFLFYRLFIARGETFGETDAREIQASFGYAYLLMLVMFLVQKISQYVFENSEFAKLKRLLHSKMKLENFLNSHMILKLSTILLVAYVVYLILGFIGIVFLFFYLTIQKALYRLKKLMIIFDTYIRIVLWACQVIPIHHFTFNKLLELIDKGYIQNFYMLLFAIPLFTNISDGRAKGMPTHESSIYRFETYMFISFLAALGSIVCLAIYSRLIHQKYMDTIERRKLKSLFQKNYLNLIIMHKMYFLLAIIGATVIYLYFSWAFFSFYTVLSVMVGLSLHALQLIYTNKIRVKKFFDVRVGAIEDESFIMRINHELALSPTYLKSICELSFASILVEISKILLMIYFFFHNIAK